LNQESPNHSIQPTPPEFVEIPISYPAPALPKKRDSVKITALLVTTCVILFIVSIVLDAAGLAFIFFILGIVALIGLVINLIKNRTIPLDKNAQITKNAQTAPVQKPLSKRQIQDERIRQMKAEGIAYCPRCKSPSLSAHQKGFSGGKALAGGILAGPVGLLAGTVGSRKVTVTCLNCGKRFKPGR